MCRAFNGPPAPRTCVDFVARVYKKESFAPLDAIAAEAACNLPYIM